MAVALTQNDKWHDSKRVHYIGTLVFSGSYPAGGEALNLATALSTPSAPLSVQILGQAGYVYQWDRTNNKVMVRQSAAAANPLGELPAAGYPGGVTGDVVRLYAIAKITG